MNRTKAQSKLRKRGYTYEVTQLKDPNWGRRTRYNKLLILIVKGHSSSWREYREHLFPGEVIRPVGTTYLHNGRKPK